jgi:hypothetical protein
METPGQGSRDIDGRIMKKKPVLWCLESPKGELYWITLGRTKQEVWGNGFETVALEEGDQWRNRYWKKWDASIRNAKKLGWNLVRVELRRVYSLKV